MSLSCQLLCLCGVWVQLLPGWLLTEDQKNLLVGSLSLE